MIKCRGVRHNVVLWRDIDHFVSKLHADVTVKRNVTIYLNIVISILDEIIRIYCRVPSIFDYVVSHHSSYKLIVPYITIFIGLNIGITWDFNIRRRSIKESLVLVRKGVIVDAIYLKQAARFG